MALGNLPGMIPNMPMNPMMSMIAPGNNPNLPPLNPLSGFPLNFPNPKQMIPGNMGPGPIPGPGMLPQADIKTKIKQILRDRAGFESM